MKWLLSLIGVPSPYILLAALAAATGIFFFGRYEGGHQQRLVDSAALASAQSATIIQMKAADQITYNISTATDARLIDLHIITESLILKVPSYVSQTADAHCTIPIGFVRLHDAAASGLPDIPLASGQSNDSPSNATLSSAASLIASNYGTCNVEIARLRALQSWITQQGALSSH